MIIWGWRGVTLGGKTGQFHCPGCDTDRNYQRKKVQRFFTLYFIPLIPLEVLQESVECQTCRKRYVLAALDHNPKADREAAQNEINDGYQRVLCHFAGLSGRTDADFIASVVAMYAELNNAVIAPEEVARRLGLSNNLGPAVVVLGRYLNDRGREIVVKNALAAATADGTLSDDKRAALADLAKSLGMTDTHFLGVVASQQAQGLERSA